jgi:hypothetical protein
VIFQSLIILSCFVQVLYIQGGSNMTGTNCDLFTHNKFRSYLNHLVRIFVICDDDF